MRVIMVSHLDSRSDATLDLIDNTRMVHEGLPKSSRKTDTTDSLLALNVSTLPLFRTHSQLALNDR